MAIVSGGTTLINGGAVVDGKGIPTATIIPWTDGTVPTGFLECDGSNVSRTTYADLFAVVGTTYGSGDGSTTFGLPDLQDKIAVGKSGTKALASTGGAENQTPAGNLSVSVSVSNHTLNSGQMPQHRHTVRKSRIAAGTGWYGTYFQQVSPNTQNSSYAGSSQSHNHGNNASGNFSGDSLSVLQPYMALIYIIKT